MTGRLGVRRRAAGPAGTRHSSAVSLVRQAGWTLATGLFVVAVPAALIIGAVRFAFSWQPVYTYAITAYHADEVTGISTPQLIAATHVIRNYFTNGQRDLDITVTDAGGQQSALFNAKEIAHMRDVKSLVRGYYLFLDLSIAYLFCFGTLTLFVRSEGPRRLARALLSGSLLTVGLILSFGVAAVVGFDQIFVEFHVLSFSNDFWELDPATDHLIQMFQQGFWFDVTMFVSLVTLAAALALAALGATYLLQSSVAEPAGAPPHGRLRSGTSDR